MKTIDDGGQAFPGIIGPPSEFANGMSLRDYIATKAMPTMLFDRGDRLPFIEAAKLSYEMADAMLAARKIKNDR